MRFFSSFSTLLHIMDKAIWCFWRADERGKKNGTVGRLQLQQRSYYWGHKKCDCYIFGTTVAGDVAYVGNPTAAPSVSWEHGKYANVCNHTTGKVKINNVLFVTINNATRRQVVQSDQVRHTSIYTAEARSNPDPSSLQCVRCENCKVSWWKHLPKVVWVFPSQFGIRMLVCGHFLGVQNTKTTCKQGQWLTVTAKRLLLELEETATACRTQPLPPHGDEDVDLLKAVRLLFHSHCSRELLNQDEEWKEN